MMTEFWYDYIINDLENLEYRIEDVILHSLTGVIMGITMKIKNIWKKLKLLFKRLSNISLK